MMLLYLCETCGHWQDESLGAGIVEAWNKIMSAHKRIPTHEEEGVQCPEGHGLMRHIGPDDRLFRRAAISAHDTQPLTSEQAVDRSTMNEVY